MKPVPRASAWKAAQSALAAGATREATSTNGARGRSPAPGCRRSLDKRTAGGRGKARPRGALPAEEGNGSGTFLSRTFLAGQVPMRAILPVGLLLTALLAGCASSTGTLDVRA